MLMLLAAKLLYIGGLGLTAALNVRMVRVWVCVRYMSGRRAAIVKSIVVIISLLSSVAALLAASLEEIVRIAVYTWLALLAGMTPLVCIPVYAGMVRSLWKRIGGSRRAESSSRAETSEHLSDEESGRMGG
ncbi:MAG: hypothetical protein Kow0062_23090 [Acidobacteriota bacterium]